MALDPNAIRRDILIISRTDVIMELLDEVERLRGVLRTYRREHWGQCHIRPCICGAQDNNERLEAVIGVGK